MRTGPTGSAADLAGGWGLGKCGRIRVEVPERYPSLIQTNPRETRGQRESTPESRTEAGPRAALKWVSKEKRRRSPRPRAAATHVTPAVLDAHNIGVLGKRDHRIHRQVQPRVGWDTVQHHRNWRQVSHLRGAEKRGEGSCPRPEAFGAWVCARLPGLAHLLDEKSQSCAP